MSKQEQNNGYRKKGVKARREEERMAYKADRYAKRHEGQEAYEDKRSARRENEIKARKAAVDRITDAEVTPSENETRIEGRNAVIEAFRSGRTVDRLYMLDGSQEGAMMTIRREAKKHGTAVKYVTRQRLDQISETGAHQGVIAILAAYHYGEIDDLFDRAREKGEDPFFILLDNIEDPHNLGAIIRTANVAGAHGVIIPKDRAVGLTATVAKASAGALNFTPVVKVTNMGRTIEDLKERGMWFVCADMDGTPMTKLNMTGSIGLVIGAEGDGVSRLVRDKCDMVASIPMKGEVNSLNASVAAGVLCYEIVRQRDLGKA